MKKIRNILVAFVAIEHLYFLVLEMFLWTSPIGLKTFNLTLEFATATVTLAANQGLYNGFLAGGLIWGLISKENGTSIKVFFLSCIVIAGIFGAVTASFSILYIQGLPAVLALLLLVLPSSNTEDGNNKT
jgi:putative membrane protein